MIIHLTYFITSHFVTMDKDPLICNEFDPSKKESEIKKFGNSKSLMNTQISWFRWAHFACAATLLLVQVMETLDLSSKTAKILN